MPSRTTTHWLNPSPEQLELAKERIRDVLSRRVVATVQILEREISDEGGQNPEPYTLGMARKILVRDGDLVQDDPFNNRNWFYLPTAAAEDVEARLHTLAPILQDVSRGAVARRRGHCLELAIYRALRTQPNALYFGGFPEFEPSKPESTRHLYRKVEPPKHIGNRTIAGEGSLDYLYLHRTVGFAGIEAKNLREWLYPNSEEVKDLLFKCVELDCVPVLVARRFPTCAFDVLGTCGVVFHETFHQLYHAVDQEIANLAMRQDSLGFDDIRIGDEPDDRLSMFVRSMLPEALPDARPRFDKFKDLIDAYVRDEIQYPEFEDRVMRRATRGELDDQRDDD